MNRTSKALLTGFIIGAAILGTAGFLLAPHLLALAGVGIAHTFLLQAGGSPIVFTATTAGITSTALGILQASIAGLAGAIGGLAGGLIGVSASKKDNNPTPASPAAQISKPKTVESCLNPTLEMNIDRPKEMPSLAQQISAQKQQAGVRGIKR